MLITSIKQLVEVTQNWSNKVVLDVETHPNNLLGISLFCNANGIYIPIKHYNKETKVFDQICDQDLLNDLGQWLMNFEFIGHSFTYDKTWIDQVFNINSSWAADTRIMWHMASAPTGPRPYGLKNAMKEELKWTDSNEDELETNVAKYGGKLRNGDHYLADLPVLAKYACLDAKATGELYAKFVPFFNKHEYWDILHIMMDYNLLLQSNTKNGILVDRAGLQKSHDRLLRVKEEAKKRFHKELKHEIESLEQDWADRRIAEYKREYNKTRYANHPEEWRRFNINSDKDKRELFYEKLGLPVLDTSEGGKPTCGADSIKRLDHKFVESYLKYEKANTLTSNFSGPYLSASNADSRLHPGFNICGTVSYRLSGFKPYLLNAPFEEKQILKNLQCDPGFVGVHADLSSIEPCITAHYSDDPALLKVFRDGLGDIYLDLALELFPNDKELQNGYNPNIPITREIKTRFEKQRKVAKVIQLAVQYTGTSHTVSRNLSKDGMPTSIQQAEGYVRAYWRKFKRIAEFNYKLKKLNAKEGHLRNVIGRIIQVPDPHYKDLSNRFIQSSAHDVLVLWVLEIYRLAKERCIEIRPILLDCHDSTSNQVREIDAEAAKHIYYDSLAAINLHLGLSVSIKAETKLFRTLAGLKGNED